MEVVIKHYGRDEMIMGPTKVLGGSRKPTEQFRSKKYPFEAALLEMTEEAEPQTIRRHDFAKNYCR
jgi:hypothetical protein